MAPSLTAAAKCRRPKVHSLSTQQGNCCMAYVPHCRMFAFIIRTQLRLSDLDILPGIGWHLSSHNVPGLSRHPSTHYLLRVFPSDILPQIHSDMHLLFL